ncbi:MAG: hypothetical protein HKO66_09650 [Saprospiraceae bacterium]|nr:BatD family protein [Bacteroidia bacterium]NNL92483.1 hypothetical protein [Saprospiraceae bacterium]
MRIVFFLLTMFVVQTMTAQSIKVEVSSDSILLGNAFKLTYLIENSENELEVPNIENMDIVGGPNYSNSIQINNGVRTSSQSVSYYLKPKTEGKFFIPPITIIEEDVVLETNAIEINVHPNPDGVITEIESNDNPFFKSFEFPFDDFKINPFFDKMEKEKKNKESKTKRKLKKI